MNTSDRWIANMLHELGIAPEQMDWLVIVINIIILIFVAFISYLIVRKILNTIVIRIVNRTTVKWDDALFNNKLLAKVTHLVPPVLVYILLPWLLEEHTTLCQVFSKALLIYIVIVSVIVVNQLFTSIYTAAHQSETFEGHSLKGLMQMLKIVAICVAIIIIISLLIDKNPIIILSGLGASAAILMLIFKDTIVGLVAGVQLSANDMLKPGDWIEAPKHGVNGMVEDVSLTTVKIRNWDMTIVTVPPYSLVSESFQNWKGMTNSGGRRVKRSINIDINSVKFMNDADLEPFTQQEWYKNYSATTDKVVNINMFRYYIVQYLETHNKVNHNMIMMVRQLQSTNYGIPIELYFFTATTEWIKYEGIQADIFDHLFAIANEFGLRIYQSPTGFDFKS